MEGVPVADTFHLPPEFHEGSTSHLPTPLIRFCLSVFLVLLRASAMSLGR